MGREINLNRIEEGGTASFNFPRCEFEAYQCAIAEWIGPGQPSVCPVPSEGPFGKYDDEMFSSLCSYHNLSAEQPGLAFWELVEYHKNRLQGFKWCGFRYFDIDGTPRLGTTYTGMELPEVKRFWDRRRGLKLRASRSMN